MAYRFRQSEIDAMKNNITAHIAHETGNKSAWRLRLAIEGQLYCCRPNKRNTAKLERRLALYNTLTINDQPNFN